MFAEAVNFVSEQGVLMVIVFYFLVGFVLFHQFDYLLLVFHTGPQLVHRGALRWCLPTQLHQVTIDGHHSLYPFDATAQGSLLCLYALFGESGGEFVP